MTSDDVLGEELGDDIVDVADVDPVDDRLAQGIPKETLELGAAWRARSWAYTCRACGKLAPAFSFASGVDVLHPWNIYYSPTRWRREKVTGAGLRTTVSGVRTRPTDPVRHRTDIV